MASLSYRAKYPSNFSKSRSSDDAIPADIGAGGRDKYLRSTSLDMKTRGGGASSVTDIVTRRAKTLILIAVGMVLLVLLYRSIFSEPQSLGEKADLDKDFLAALQKHRLESRFPPPFSFVPFTMKECTELLNNKEALNIYQEYISRRSAFETTDPKKVRKITQEDVQEKEKEVIYFALVKSGHFDTVCTNGLFTGTDDALPVLLWPSSKMYIIHDEKTDNSKSDEIVQKLSQKFKNRVEIKFLEKDLSDIKGKCNLVVVNGKGNGAKKLLDRVADLVDPYMHFVIMTNMKPGSVLHTAWEKKKGGRKIRKVFSCEFHTVMPQDKYLPTVLSKIAVGRLEYHT